MQHPGLVRRVQPGERGEDDRARLLARDAVAVETAVHRPAVEAFHDQQVLASGADVVVDRHDVRVVEAGQNARLAVEKLAARLVVEDVPRQLLDRDAAAERAVDPGEDDAHPAFADGAADVVLRQRGDDLGRCAHPVNSSAAPSGISSGSSIPRKLLEAEFAACQFHNGSINPQLAAPAPCDEKHCGK